MANSLVNILKAHASELDYSFAQVRFGIVTSVNGQTGFVRVMLQPGSVLSGWLPVLTPWLGNGWGLSCPFTPGDQVVVVPQGGDAEQGIVIGGVFSRKQMPPSTPVGEFWLVHNNGNAIKLCNDGTTRIIGDLHVSGDIYDNAGPLSRLRSAYNAHVHRIGTGATGQATPADVGS